MGRGWVKTRLMYNYLYKNCALSHFSDAVATYLGVAHLMSDSLFITNASMWVTPTN